jgi:transposase-like protein
LDYERWSQRRLEDQAVVYVWADGLYVKAGLERDTAALLVVIGALADGPTRAEAEGRGEAFARRYRCG